MGAFLDIQRHPTCTNNKRSKQMHNKDNADIQSNKKTTNKYYKNYNEYASLTMVGF